MDIAKDKHIDKYALDEECAKQPSLYGQYAEALAEAEYKLDIAKNKLAVAEAEAGHLMRLKGETPQGVKVTEKSVAEAILFDENVKKYNNRVIKAQYEVKLLKAATGAMEQKKSMLGSLVKMYLVGYYNSASLPIDGKTANDISDEELRALNEEE